MHPNAEAGWPPECSERFSSVRSPPPPQTSRPHRRRTDVSVKKTDCAPPRGVLAMGDDELAVFIRDSGITFPVLTPEAEAEARRENEFLEAHESGAVREAIESGAIWRKKPGRKLVRAVYLEMAQKCLDEANGNLARARETFIEQAMKSQRIKRESAESRWAEAIKTLFPDR